MLRSSLLLLFFIASCFAGRGPQPFNCIVVKDFHLDKSDFFHLTEAECARRCVDSVKDWAGYHYDKGRCYPLIAGLNWRESSAGRPLRVCIYRPNPACSQAHFPWSFGRSRYAFVTKKMTWRRAASHCEGKRAKLLQLSSPAEQSFIAHKLAILRKRMYPYAFIGLLKLPMYTHLNEKRKGWVWHRSADPLHRSLAWSTGQPDNYSKSQMIGALFPNGRLDDGFYWHHHYSICECFLI